MFKLADYLHDRGIIHKRFAKKVGVSPTYFHQIIRQGKSPNLFTAVKIEEETGGHVSVYDWEVKPNKRKVKKAND